MDGRVGGHFVILFWIYLACVAPAGVLAALMVLQAWEHRRFVTSRLARRPIPLANVKVALLAPCKGIDLGLVDNLSPLFAQSGVAYELVFIVEDRSDPAASVIDSLIRRHPGRPARIVVAGRAERCGQKVHNLLAGVRSLSGDVNVLAFVDSDARPGPDWLATLVSRLDRGEVGACTSYRCFVPARSTLPNLLLYAINSGVMGLFGSGGRHLVWGGSWAIRRDVFHHTRIESAWEGTLSDDLVASRQIRRAGLAVAFEPACAAASPIDVSARGLFEFLRRQYVIGRRYAPWWWAGALAMVGTGTLGFTLSLAMLAAGLATLAAWWWVPACMTGWLWAAGALKGWLRQDAIRRMRPELGGRLRAGRLVDVWASPLVACANLHGLALSLFGNSVAWRNIRYRIARGGQVKIESREPIATRPSNPQLRAPHSSSTGEARSATTGNTTRAG